MLDSDEVFVEHDGTHLHGSGGSIVPIDDVSVLGTISSVKYRVSAFDNSESYILVKFFVSFSPNAQPEVRTLQKVQVTMDSPLEFTESLLHNERCPEPVQPEPEAPVAAVARPPTAEEKEILDSESVKTLVQDVSCD